MQKQRRAATKRTGARNATMYDTCRSADPYKRRRCNEQFFSCAFLVDSFLARSLSGANQ